jgi:hypothetical protein
MNEPRKYRMLSDPHLDPFQVLGKDLEKSLEELVDSRDKKILVAYGALMQARKHLAAGTSAAYAVEVALAVLAE